mmetsp:Transcript_2014/g.4273  ORF Transcript_2014/g.4273 Transcript_2014/m.4273 type:complete len:205 (+) Transcript_2014:172-786(+)
MLIPAYLSCCFGCAFTRAVLSWPLLVTNPPAPSNSRRSEQINYREHPLEGNVFLKLSRSRLILSVGNEDDKLSLEHHGLRPLTHVRLEVFRRYSQQIHESFGLELLVCDRKNSHYVLSNRFVESRDTVKQLVAAEIRNLPKLDELGGVEVLRIAHEVTDRFFGANFVRDEVQAEDHVGRGQVHERLGQHKCRHMIIPLLWVEAI